MRPSAAPRTLNSGERYNVNRFLLDATEKKEDSDWRKRVRSKSRAGIVPASSTPASVSTKNFLREPGCIASTEARLLLDGAPPRERKAETSLCV